MRETPLDFVEANGIRIAYQSYGPDDGEVVVFIQGVGGAMPTAPDPLTMAVAARGYRVVVFDNRDAGASTHFDESGLPDFAAIRAAAEAGKKLPIAYTLADMTADVAGLLKALGVDHAHIVGGSSGGVIAQMFAAKYPARTSSLTLISTTTANPSLRRGEAPVDVASLAPGTARQAAATAVAGDLRGLSASIRTPTVVVHGSGDQLFPIAHGRDAAATIPGAQLRIIAGMGHEPRRRQDMETIVEAIVSVAQSRHQPLSP